MSRPSTLLLRRLIALALLALSLWMWTRHSDVIQLIVRQRPVLFGRYSQGHFGALLLLTPILWTLAAVCWSRRPFLQGLGNATIGIVTTVVAALLITYLSHFFHRPPRYVEVDVPQEQAQGLELAAAVRHRPPNQVYELVYKDVPEQARSYPNPPPGYPDVPLRLTSDANGFRNFAIQSQYDIVAVGDSFVACSNVDDAQCWPALLAKESGKSLYNLGVGGSGPPIYLSNFAYFGLKLKPKLALFMIYEGNDFKEDVVIERAPSASKAQPSLGQRLSAHFEYAIDASPVKSGLKRLSADLFEKLGSQRPVPGYTEKIGWMPIELATPAGARYYSFDPKRLVYLNYSKEQFSASPEWQATAKMLQQIVNLSRRQGIHPVFLYAPSTPHVVMPLAADAIPAQQLRTFVAYRKKGLPEADAFKREVFANLDSEEHVVMDFCAQQQVDCLSLTPALRTATAAGRQTYFTYDQHWTPDGNAVTAAAVGAFLREKGLL